MNNLINRIKRLFDSFPIYSSDMLIIGSTTLYLLNLIKKPRDIDIVIKSKSWRLMFEKYGKIKTPIGFKINQITHPDVEFLDIIGNGLDFNLCYKKSIIINKIHFMNPNDVLTWNYRMGREKDFDRNLLLEKYLE